MLRILVPVVIICTSIGCGERGVPDAQSVEPSVSVMAFDVKAAIHSAMLLPDNTTINILEISMVASQQYLDGYWHLTVLIQGNGWHLVSLAVGKSESELVTVPRFRMSQDLSNGPASRDYAYRYYPERPGNWKIRDFIEKFPVGHEPRNPELMFENEPPPIFK